MKNSVKQIIMMNNSVTSKDINTPPTVTKRKAHPQTTAVVKAMLEAEKN